MGRTPRHAAAGPCHLHHARPCWRRLPNRDYRRMGRLMRCAMVLAAGLGLRMRPLTENTAKPLLPLGGRTLLDHALDRLAAAGMDRVVVNTHWQGDRVEQHLAKRPNGPEIVLRPEFALLDTGGAVRSALADGVLGDEPFFIINGDS